MHLIHAAAVPAAIFLAGCAAVSAPSAPATPAALRPPADQVLQFEALAAGVQIYECSRKADATHEWVFKAPEATLASRSGQSLGRHYAGPTWESPDGSTVVGEVKGRDAGPDPSAIPWLLLTAKKNTGAGTFGTTRSIQRVATRGGVAPSTACDATQVGQMARVPYTATYYFYR